MNKKWFTLMVIHGFLYMFLVSLILFVVKGWGRVIPLFFSIIFLYIAFELIDSYQIGKNDK